MKRIIAITVLVALILTTVGGSNIAFAHNSGSYAHDTSNLTSNPDWMLGLNNNFLISELSIPGTHDSMTFKDSSDPVAGGDLAKCQAMDLTQQLQSGIRALDIRLAPVEVNGEVHLLVFHGSFYQGSNFDDVLTTVQTFLKAHQGETILMRIQTEDITMGMIDILNKWSSESKLGLTFNRPDFISEIPFAELFEPYAHKYENLMWIPDKPVKIPKLGDVRSKVVVLQNFDGTYTTGVDSKDESIVGRNFGIPFDDTFIVSQDMFTVYTTTMYDKWLKIKTQMTDTNNAYMSLLEKKLYINHLSANGVPISLPYFIASGHVTSATNSERLWTGQFDQSSVNSEVVKLFLDAFADGEYKDIIPLFNKGVYPDFPREDTTIPHLELVKVSKEVKVWLNPIKWVWDTITEWVEKMINYTLHPVFFEGMNELAMDHLGNYSRVGIIMADFPGPDLIDSIIQMNPWRDIPFISVETPNGPATLFSGERLTVNATFTDAGKSQVHQAKIDWGDSYIDTLPSDGNLKLTENAPPAPGIINGSHQYAIPGKYTGTVFVTGSEGTGDDSFVVDVRPIPIDITLRPIINIKSNGSVQVIVYGKSDFDVSKILMYTVGFGPNKAAVFQNSTADVNGDGVPDRILHFRTAEIGLTEADTVLNLIMQNSDGIYFGGECPINTPKPQK